jgi:hypothetical protein
MPRETVSYFLFRALRCLKTQSAAGASRLLLSCRTCRTCGRWSRKAQRTCF